MNKRICCGVSLLFLAGCATDETAPPPPAAPPPPGAATHRVVQADETGIRFHFDDARTDAGRLLRLAREHCDRYDKDAQPIGVDAAEQGLRQANFACVAGQ